MEHCYFIWGATRKPQTIKITTFKKIKTFWFKVLPYAFPSRFTDLAMILDER